MTQRGGTRRIRREQSVLLVIDLQQKLIPAMVDGQGLLRMTERLLSAARILEIPSACTEQYPKGLGPTVEPVCALMSCKEIRPKMHFSSCRAEGLMDELMALGRRQVIIIGIEAHVCVQQTVLDLLEADFQVFVCVDGISSRRPLDRDVALGRMQQAGAVLTTTESVIFEWLEEAGTPQFKEVAQLVREV
jgi:nicotinamidase-related amidase